ncbi:hypothetical protein IEQ34_025284 [Dendrobium chrysotoxum]|uniref:Uncharacterized protein n=1 Tax=Dendrobium chrysotoxum TaxID=161865 RepID=A0AAV7FQB4_DENCH|nr:hypothetical protein IEQ34_025284 [Dendrobium chrysotoxum]
MFELELVIISKDLTTICLRTRTKVDLNLIILILHGHNHFVSDVTVSSDGQFALSASWDKTLRLWDLTTGTTARRFVGHTGDVLSVSFSADNRQIVSGSRDRTIKLWNTLGECKFNIQEDGHSEWVSCVRFSPNPSNPVIVSAGWDKVVKVSFLFFRRLQKGLVGMQVRVNESIRKVGLEKGVRTEMIVINICYYGELHSCSSMRISLTTKIAESRLEKNKGGDCLGIVQMQAQDKPLRSHRIHQHSHCIADGSLCASGAPPVIGCVLLLQVAIKIFDLESKSIVEDIKPEFTNVGKDSPDQNALLWHGLPMVLLCSLVTVTTRFAFSPLVKYDW